MNPSSTTNPAICKGLLRRRNILLPTAKGVLLMLVLAVIGLAAMLKIVPWFLAPTAPVRADLLILEGWASDEMVRGAIKEFNTQGYKRLMTTGGPLDVGHWLIEYKTFAELEAAVVIKTGFPAELVTAVPGKAVAKDRTYAAALSLKEYLVKEHPEIKSFDIYSIYTHSRRSWMLYRMAFGPDYRIGIIAGESQELDGKPWWQTSTGVRDVMSETIAYLYARILFRP